MTFQRPFLLKDVGRLLPAGNYQVLTDEELIEGLSFLAYRRIATLILLPAKNRSGSIEMVVVDPNDIEAAQQQDRK